MLELKISQKMIFSLSLWLNLVRLMHKLKCKSNFVFSIKYKWMKNISGGFFMIIETFGYLLIWHIFRANLKFSIRRIKFFWLIGYKMNFVIETFYVVASIFVGIIKFYENEEIFCLGIGSFQIFPLSLKDFERKIHKILLLFFNLSKCFSKNFHFSISSI